METNKISSETAKSKRSSIKACIIESWKTFAMHPGTFLKYLWFHLLIAGIGFGLFSAEVNKFNTEHILSTQKFIESGIDQEVANAIFAPSTSDILIAITACLAFLFSTYLMYGAIYTQIRFYKATDALPCSGPFSFWKELRKDGLRALMFDILLLLVTSLSISPVVVAAFYFNPWILLGIIPILIYWAVIGYNGRLQYVVEQKSLKTAIKNGFHTGHHKFGGFFILILLTSIPLALVSVIVFQPVSLFHLASCADRVPTLAGYPSGIAAEFLPVHILVATAGYFIYNFVFALQQWPLALYTSAVCGKTKTNA